MNPRILILSKDRPSAITAPKVFDGYDVWIFVHNETQKAMYKANAEKMGYDPARLIVTNTDTDIYGKLRQIQWVFKNIVANEETFVFCDDNVRGLTRVDPAVYNLSKIDVQSQDSRTMKEMFSHPLDAKTFLTEIFVECQNKLFQNETYHCGFSPTNNYYFRGKHWNNVGCIIGKLMVFRQNKKYHLDFNSMIEDYDWTAQSLYYTGVSLVNNWVYPIKEHYKSGGLGTIRERSAARLASIEYLMKKWPGLFVRKDRSNGNPDFTLRIHNVNQISRWRKQMKMLYSLEKGNNNETR